MKPKALIPLAVALVTGGGFLLSQRQLIFSVKQETVALSRLVELAQAERAGPGVAPSVREDGREASFDWKKSLADQEIAYSRSEERQFQKGVEAMSSAEISSVLDQIAAMDLPDKTRKKWAKKFLPELAVKGPQTALNRFYEPPKSREGKSFPDSNLTTALANWAKKDPAGACAWLDGEMKKSDLSNKSISGYSEHQISFEAALFGVLIFSDPATAGKRLMAVSENEAASVIAHLSFSGPGVDPVLLAKLTRDTLSEKRRIELFTQEAENVARNYEDVTGFLDRISASPAERTACVQGAASRHLGMIGEEKKLTVEDIDTMRAWATANQSGPVGKITGRAIGDVVDSSPGITFNEARAMVMDYHEKTPNDDLIVGFLESEARRRGSSKEIQAVLAKIEDPVKRAEVENGFK